MTDQTENFAQQLMAADTDSTRTDSQRDQVLKELLDREKSFERKLGKVALFSWAVVLGCIVVFSVCSIIVRNEGGSIIEVAKMILMICGAVGMISLIIAFLATLRWMFRSQTSSLAVIERRLAALESLIKESGQK